MVDYVFGDGGAESHHPISQPFRDTTAVEWKVGDAGTLHVFILIAVQSEISDSLDAGSWNPAVE